jgi:hypothetical protein
VSVVTTFGGSDRDGGEGSAVTAVAARVAVGCVGGVYIYDLIFNKHPTTTRSTTGSAPTCDTAIFDCWYELRLRAFTTLPGVSICHMLSLPLSKEGPVVAVRDGSDMWAVVGRKGQVCLLSDRGVAEESGNCVPSILDLVAFYTSPAPAGAVGAFVDHSRPGCPVPAKATTDDSAAIPFLSDGTCDAAHDASQAPIAVVDLVWQAPTATEVNSQHAQVKRVSTSVGVYLPPLGTVGQPSLRLCLIPKS